VLPYAAGTNHPGYFAFIPYFTTWPAAVAELVGAAANLTPWAWMESPAATQPAVQAELAKILAERLQQR